MKAERIDDYLVFAAERTTECPHCPEEIKPGEAIVRRPEDPASCHHSCALEQDRIDADPAAYAAEQFHEYERRRQAEIKANIARGPVQHRQPRRRRKARRGRATA